LELFWTGKGEPLKLDAALAAGMLDVDAARDFTLPARAARTQARELDMEYADYFVADQAPAVLLAGPSYMQLSAKVRAACATLQNADRKALEAVAARNVATEYLRPSRRVTSPRSTWTA
jgi:hypothetical protein